MTALDFTATGLLGRAAPVPDPRAPPYSAVGMLMMHWTTGLWYSGSGALIDDRTILTCAHNLVDQQGGRPPLGRADGILFYPAYNQVRPQIPPPNGLEVVSAVYPNAYVNGQDAWDVGICRLRHAYLPPQPRFFFQPRATGEELVGVETSLAGYPGPAMGEMWWDRDEVNGVELTTNTCLFTHDTWRGNSGSPVWTYDANRDVVVQHAIHVSQSPGELRRGVLITTAVDNWIRANRGAVQHAPHTTAVALG
jgi:V8-like Glu-specific endopeptidase